MEAVKMEVTEAGNQSNVNGSEGFNVSRGGRGGGRGRGGRGMGMSGRGRGRGGMSSDSRPARQQEDRVFDRLQALQGNTMELSPREFVDKKFTNHCRLFVGNIPQDMKKEELEELFKKFGETSEIFLNTDKAFAFVKLDYRPNAEKAKAELDGFAIRGRSLKIRFAAHGAALRVKNVSPFVSNELLERAFSVFGEIENAIVNTDSKGKPTGEGKVEYCSKPAAMLALKMCSEGCFFLTRSPRPVIVEMLVEEDNTEGHPEKGIQKRHPDYKKEREVSPRFAPPGSFEFEYGSSWKALYDLQRQKSEALDSEMRYEKEKLEEQMEYAKYEHETNMLRDQLRKVEMERERQMRDSEMRQRQRDEQRQREEEMYRNRQKEMQSGLLRREEEMKRRAQDNSSSFIDGNPNFSESGYGNRDYGNKEGNVDRGNLPLDPKAFMDSFAPREGGANYPPGYEAGFEHAAAHQGSWGDREDYNKRRRWQ